MTSAPAMRILTIEDEEVVRGNITAYLEDSGYLVIQASNGREGMDIFRSGNPDLVLVDLRMPGMNGLEVLDAIGTASPETPVIIVSGTGVMRDAIEALRLGAWDFVTKPIMDMDVLGHAVKRALERARLLRENRRYREHLEDEVRTRTEEIEQQAGELAMTNEMLKEEILERWRVEEELKKSISVLQKTIDGAISTISLIGELRDAYTGGHQRRVAQLANAVAGELGFSEDKMRGVYVAGMLHDIGKISVPIEILCKPTAITSLEYSLLKLHPKISWEILKEIEFPWPVAKIVRQHHERMDGSGFPDRLKGDEICMEARIIGVADVVEAMASHRPYREALGIDKAMDEIKRNRGVLYDAGVVDACVRLFDEKGFVFIK